MQNQKVIFLIPFSHLVNLLIKHKFARYTNKQIIRPTSQNKLLSEQDFKIVKAYNYILCCINFYYSGISDNKSLVYIQHLLRFSCAMTLAHKHKSTLTKIFSLYGKNLKVKSEYISQHKYMLPKWQVTNYFLDPFLKY